MVSFVQWVLYSLLTTLVWFIIGAVVYMNPFVAKVYKRYHKHPSMKHFSTLGRYLLGVFFIAGFIPIAMTLFVYSFFDSIHWSILGLGLFMVRIVPRFCDSWMQTSYPNVLLWIELVNGFILSFVTAYMFSILLG